ncbi:lipoprotein, partial [Listeria grandensis FSL F6-0971]
NRNSKAAAMKDGEFSFYAADKKIKKTDEIIMVAYDKNGDELARQLVKFVVVTEGKLTPVEMTIPGDNNVTGTYTGDITKIELTVNGKIYKGGTVANSTFKFYSKDKVMNETDVVVIKGYDSTGKLLDTQTVKIKSTAPTAGTITPAAIAIPGDKNVVGTYTGDVKSLVLTVDGVEYKGGTIANGEFKFYTYDKIKSATSEVTLKAYDKVGKLLDTQTVDIKSSAPTVGTITPAVIAIPGDKNVVGTYTGEVKSLVLSVDGVEYKGGTIANGEFKFYAYDKIKSATSEVTLKAYDKAGRLLDTQTVEIKSLAPAPTAGTITPVVMTIPGDKNVIGTYTGEVKSLVLTVDGVEYKGGTIANGEFKFYTYDKIKSATSE